MDGIEVFNISLDNEFVALGGGPMCKVDKKVSSGHCSLEKDSAKKCQTKCTITTKNCQGSKAVSLQKTTPNTVINNNASIR